MICPLYPNIFPMIFSFLGFAKVLRGPKKIPSGKRLHNYMENHNFQWDNSLYTNGPFSIAFCMFTRGYIPLISHWISIKTQEITIKSHFSWLSSIKTPLNHPWLDSPHGGFSGATGLKQTHLRAGRVAAACATSSTLISCEGLRGPETKAPNWDNQWLTNYPGSPLGKPWENHD